MRSSRSYEGKENVIIYDYVDTHIPMFDNMYAKRLKAYKQIGYEICGGAGNTDVSIHATGAPKYSFTVAVNAKSTQTGNATPEP